LEISAELVRGSAPRGGLSLLRSPDGREETRLCVDWERGALTLERGRSGEQPDLPDLSAPFEGKDTLRIHLYLDGSTLECILDQRAALSGRVYPARSDSLEAGLFAEGGEILVRRLDVYHLDTAW
jgi:beta-fructofuranosidase